MAKLTFFPSSDAALFQWSLNFSTLISAGATSYGLTTAQATAYAALHAAYATALAACDPSTRSKAAVSTKNLARTNLKNNARLLANLVNGTASVTNAQKITLGLNVKASPSPIPVPSTYPAITVKSVSAWTVKIRLSDTASSGTRGKPAGTSGASVFSYVGAVAPSNMAAWTFEGNVGRTVVDVVFPNTLLMIRLG